MLRAVDIHRAAGVLLGMACGDALGAHYEFGPPLGPQVPVDMIGGGAFGWEPGEWTDDTQMALVIARAVQDGSDLRDADVLDEVAAGWYGWAREARDVGAQTSQVLGAAGRLAGRNHAPNGPASSPCSRHLKRVSRELHERTGHTAGNGSLMRTAPVALVYLDDADALVEAAVEVSALTHFDPEAGEACVLWCLAIRHAVLTGELNVRVGLAYLDEARASVWSERIDEAERHRPAHFGQNGWVVQALQAAWSAIHSTRERGQHAADHLRLALEAAVRGGRDTDTVAAIAGGLLGAAYGASAVPAQWRRIVHGWPGLRARDLIALGVLIARQGQSDAQGWPAAPRIPNDPSAHRLDRLSRHPHDAGVWIGGIDSLVQLPAEVDAVVSLCRLGVDEAPAAGVLPQDHVEVYLVDSDQAADNPHLEFVLADTAETVAHLRAEGHTVLLHCVAAESRTPTVAVEYAIRALGIPLDQALAEVLAALPGSKPNPRFLEVLAEERS